MTSRTAQVGAIHRVGLRRAARRTWQRSNASLWVAGIEQARPLGRVGAGSRGERVVELLELRVDADRGERRSGTGASRSRLRAQEVRRAPWRMIVRHVA